MEVRGRFFKVPSQSFFLFGPRGTGKSTWLRHELPGALFVDWLKPEVYREMHARPEEIEGAALEGLVPSTSVPGLPTPKAMPRSATGGRGPASRLIS